MILSLGGPISPWNYNFRWPLPVMIHRNQSCNIRYRWWNVGQSPTPASPAVKLFQFEPVRSTSLILRETRNVKLVLKLQTGKIVWIGLLYFSHSKYLSMTKQNLPLTDYSYEWKCGFHMTISRCVWQPAGDFVISMDCYSQLLNHVPEFLFIIIGNIFSPCQDFPIFDTWIMWHDWVALKSTQSIPYSSRSLAVGPEMPENMQSLLTISRKTPSYDPWSFKIVTTRTHLVPPTP